MKFADAPKSVQKRLDAIRYPCRHKPLSHRPLDGDLWFDCYRQDEEGNRLYTERGDPLEWGCSVCGTDRGNRWCQDHCHETGLVRGTLCPSCNVDEAHGSDDPDHIWFWWRLTAPELTIGRRHVRWTFWPGYERLLTDEERLTLPMAELLELVDVRRGIPAPNTNPAEVFSVARYEASERRRGELDAERSSAA